MKRQTAFVLVSEGEVVHGKHEWGLNTPGALEEAAQQGKPYHSIYSYSSPPNPNDPAPYIYGDLWLVTNERKNWGDTLEAMRRVVDGILAMHSDIDPTMLRYYLDSGGTVYLRIPAPIFGGSCGVPLLPMFHEQMTMKLLAYGGETKAKLATRNRLACFEPTELPGVKVRDDVYELNRPFMFLEPGLRAGGKSTVEIDYKSFMYMYSADLWAKVERGDHFPIEAVVPRITSLYKVYDAIMFSRCELLYPSIRKESVTKCPYFKSCMEYPENVDEKKQGLLLRMLAPLGPEGLKMAQAWGEKVIGSSEVAIRQAFMDAMQQRELVTCAEVAHERFCDGSCGVHSPYDLEEKEQAGAVVMENYRETKSGLYCVIKNEETNEIIPVKVYSPIFTLGKVCNPDGSGWRREVKLEAPDKKSHILTIPNAECMKQNPDTLLALLCDYGLELAPGKHSAGLLKRYFREASPSRIKVGVKSLGWVGDCYVLPEVVLGHYEKKPQYLGDVGAFQVAGTLADWITRVGVFCQGNSLFQLAVQFALTGPLLGPCAQEGGGLHVYGPSSSGKTTLALVAGSVCGGRPGKGYISQWRSTANALESTAARHNDGLLVLDEIGEANSDTVFQASYMLTNGQGKERLRADATAKKAFQWRLNYLSSGEVATSEKIEAGGRYKSMAGQEVRIINLPVLGADGENIFKNLHGFKTAAALSDHLKAASKEVYGTLLRAFLVALCGANPEELHANVENISQDARRFEERVCPKDVAGQVRRVAIKFGYMAAVGAFVARRGLLPWSEEEAVRVAEEWFEIWLAQRGGTGDLEIEKAIKAIQEEWALHKENHYHNLDNHGDGSGFTRELHGFYWKENGEVVFFIKSEIFTRLTGSVNRKELLDKMKEKGMLLMRKGGAIMDTKSISGQNSRGFGFRPSAWLGMAEEVVTPTSPSGKLYEPSDDLADDVF